MALLCTKTKIIQKEKDVSLVLDVNTHLRNYRNNTII